MTLVLVSCNQKNKEATNNETIENTTNHKKDETGVTFRIVSNYLKVKDALTKDDSKAAAEFAKDLYNSFKNAKTDKLSDNQKKQFAVIAEDAKVHSEHIGSNEGNIEHHREHFVSLSKDIADLIELLGTNQKLYLEYCPMANNDKGAVWMKLRK